jgi:hypothetical protein
VRDAYSFEEWAFSKKKIQWDLPLPAAYQFAAANGLGVQAEAIRKVSSMEEPDVGCPGGLHHPALTIQRSLLKSSRKSTGLTMRQKEARRSFERILGWF